MPQLRQNIITGEWVVIAPERAKRPSDYTHRQKVKDEVVESCVFCLDGTEYQKSIKEFETDEIYVLPNKYPAFIEKPEACSPRTYAVEDDFYRMRPSTGGHDVVVIKDKDTSLPKFSHKIWQELLEVTRRRVEYFYKICNVVSVVPIYNHGPSAGASVHHPHAQNFAANVVPNIISRELHQTESYFEDHGACAFCDLISHERKEKVRILFESETFVAFTLYAARFPFEIWVLPKRHGSRFERIDPREIDGLATAMRSVIQQLDKTLDDPPLNYFIHTLPDTYSDVSYYHWHVEIAPRIAGYGGFEMGSGLIIDVMSPEKAASYLKKGES